MKKLIYLTLSILTLACGDPEFNAKQDTMINPKVDYKVINSRSENGTQFYDIYLKDAAAIKSLNDYLKYKYNGGHKTWIEINYFDDSSIARDYLQKQFDNNLSDREKDKLFRHFVANYKYNPNTGYDSLISEHWLGRNTPF